jgi:plastocyanin
MRLSSRSMVWLAGVGSMLLAIPALAQSQGNPDTASYTSFDSAATGAMFRWYVTGTTTTDVTIAQHGTVTFTNPSSTSRAHNIDFVSDQKPQCKLSTETATSTAPMPPKATAGQWSGTCVFDQPGTYHFICDNPFHPNMAGVITVAALPASTPTPTPTPGAAGSPTPTQGPAAAPTPTGGSQPTTRPNAATSITVNHHQKGTHVKGSLVVSQPGTRVEIALLSRRAALGLSGRRRVRVGRFVVASAPAGPMRFSVALNRAARRALRLRGTLPTLVRVKASAPATVSVDRLQAVRLGRVPAHSEKSR